MKNLVIISGCFHSPEFTHICTVHLSSKIAPLNILNQWWKSLNSDQLAHFQCCFYESCDDVDFFKDNATAFSKIPSNITIQVINPDKLTELPIPFFRDEDHNKMIEFGLDYEVVEEITSID